MSVVSKGFVTVLWAWIACNIINGIHESTYFNKLQKWGLKSPASRLFTQQFIQAQIKENIKASRHWLLCGEFTRLTLLLWLNFSSGSTTSLSAKGSDIASDHSTTWWSLDGHWLKLNSTVGWTNQEIMRKSFEAFRSPRDILIPQSNPKTGLQL